MISKWKDHSSNSILIDWNWLCVVTLLQAICMLAYCVGYTTPMMRRSLVWYIQHNTPACRSPCSSDTTQRNQTHYKTICTDPEEPEPYEAVMTAANIYIVFCLSNTFNWGSNLYNFQYDEKTQLTDTYTYVVSLCYFISEEKDPARSEAYYFIAWPCYYSTDFRLKHIFVSC